MKTSNKYIGAFMLGLAALSVTSCSDTWDEHYESVNSSVATQSLWEILSTNPNTTKFAELAEMVKYHRDQDHPQADYTFRDMLEGKQAITVWVPTNNAYTDQEWENWKQMAETSPYSVQQQILGNSIALWRQVVSAGGNDTITMINGKKYVFDKVALTMGSQSLVAGEYNIPASNGTLHTVDKFLPFNYNIYEYLKDTYNAANKGITEMNKVIIDNDTTYFDRDNSVEGAPDIMGNPTYVDSMYVTSNNLFLGTRRYPTNVNTEQYLTYDEGFGANIIGEDSSFIMLIPTDQAWQEAKNMLKPYYNYAKVYVDNEKENLNVKNAKREVTNLDSLTEKCITMDLISPLVFNVNMQPDATGNIGRWKTEDFLQNSTQAKHFLNTYGDTLRSDETWNKESLLEGERVKMSNGYGIITNKWNFPAKFYKPDVNVEMNGYSVLYKNADANYTPQTLDFANSVAEEWIDTVGRVNDNNFTKFIHTNTRTLSIQVKLLGNKQEIIETEVMSGKYDIYVVMVPAFYEYSGSELKGDTLKAKIRATLNYISDPTSGKETSAKYDLGNTYTDYYGEKVDTILLFKDFEFPFSYKNLQYSYPTLELQCKYPSTSERKDGYSSNICIDRIILKSKD